MEAQSIHRVRAFNRIVTERIGALTDHFLGRDRPMGEARTLWEVGAKGVEVRELRARLGLDSGYASRVLRSLERQKLVKVEASSDDARVRRVRLTAKGRAERKELDRLSDKVARSVLEPLSDGERERLVAAVTEVEKLLRASMVSFTVEAPTTPDARWCLGQYFAELNQRFEGGFDPDSTIPADERMMPPAGAFLVARLRGRPVACGAVMFHAREPAYLKRMWVAPEARGIGLGKRLLRELERHAREAGCRKVRLETNRALTEAIAMYRASGYREVARFNDEPYGHHWFEKRLS